MKKLSSIIVTVVLLSFSVGQAATIVVNSTNNTATPPAGETNFFLALTLLQNGDTINFNIDPTNGPGPYYLEPPNGGFPMITANNVTIDGYSQPGSSPNTNSVIGTNNAVIKIVLSATNSVFHELYNNMDYNSQTNQGVGFNPFDEYNLLAIFGANNLEIKGLCLLGRPYGGVLASHYAIGLAQDTVHPCTNFHMAGCWIGIDPNGVTTRTFDTCVVAFSHKAEVSYRFRGTNADPGILCGFDKTISSRDPAHYQSDGFIVDNFIATNTCVVTNFTVTTNVSSQRYVHSNHIFGVKPGAHNILAARAQQNVMLGGIIEMDIEGQAFRVGGNKVGVYPDGNHDYITPFAELGQIMEGVFEIGRGASDCVVGTDGDGNNDAEERNMFGGVVTDGRNGWSHNLNGYSHTIEFYSASGSAGSDRTRNRIAGNYIGLGADGVTRFTNGVPFCNASTTGASQYWIGSDFDGVSDDLEANVIYNNYSGNPATALFYDTIYTNSNNSGQSSQGFFDQIGNSSIITLRGNVLVNNYPYPVNPRVNGFLSTFVTKAMATPLTASNAVLAASSTSARIRGTAPVGKEPYKWTILDFYTPDPEGMSNGVVVADSGLPNGWVQGKKYLGSYTIATTNKNTAPNLVTNAGQFDLNVCSLGLTNGDKITVTVNYSQDPPGTHNARILTTPFSPPLTITNGIVITSVSRSGSTFTINWCGNAPPYKLQRKFAIGDAWIDIQTGLPGPSTTDTISNPDAQALYRIVGN